LAKLETVAIEKRATEDTRQFIRDQVTDNHSAFDALRDKIVIQMVYDGRLRFWDGYGCEAGGPLSCDGEAEIIFALEPSMEYAVAGVFEGLTQENNESHDK